LKAALRLSLARALLGTGVFVLSQPLLAASSADADTPAEQRPVLEEVVVTAQKREERAQDVPISLAVLSGADLDSSSMQSAGAALGMVPGVTFDTSGVSGQARVSIRGVTAAATTFEGSSPVAYYLDSVPFGLVTSAIVPDPDIYDLDRIEVLRGPQGTLYGANALNGVVRVLTNDADLNEFEFKGRTGVSSTDGGSGNYDGDMAVNVPIVDGKLAARLVVDEAHDSGWINSPVKTGINDDDKKSVRLKVTAAPSDDLTIKLSASHQEADYGAPPLATRDYTTSTQSEPIDIHYNTFDAKVDYQAPWFSVSSASSYLTYDSYASTDTDPGLPASEDPPLTTQLNSHVFTEEVNLNSRLEGPWRWSLGGFYRDALDTLVQTFGDFIPAPVDEQDSSRSAAVFGELARRFLDNQLELSVGGRYFHDDVGMQQLLLFGQPEGTPLLHSSAPYHATTPRVVLSWFPDRDLMVYTSYSQGFRSGFPQDELTQLVAPDLNSVKPDKLSNYEIGAKGDWLDHRLSFDTAVYYMKWDDIQQSLGITIPGSQATITADVNGQAASGMGVDLAVTYRPITALSLGLSFSWNGLAEDEAVYSGGQLLFSKGARIDASPAYTGAANAQYTFPFGATEWSGTMKADGHYTSKQTTTSTAENVGEPPEVVESNTIITGRVSFTVAAPSHWHMMLYCNNVGNNRGVPLASEFLYQSNSMRPRTTGLQVDYSYK
jgi:iron complex outermembrane receptor protein